MPKGWTGGIGVEVGEITIKQNSKKFNLHVLKPSDKLDRYEFATGAIPFPENWKVEIKMLYQIANRTNWYILYHLLLGNMYIDFDQSNCIDPFIHYDSGINTIGITYDNDKYDKIINGPKSEYSVPRDDVFSLTIEKRSPLFRIYINNDKIMTARIDDYEQPENIRFNFHGISKSSFAILKITGTALP